MIVLIQVLGSFCTQAQHTITQLELMLQPLHEKDQRKVFKPHSASRSDGAECLTPSIRDPPPLLGGHGNQLMY